MKGFKQFISEQTILTEEKVGAYSDEHAHARVWNHMTSLGIAHDKKAMIAEFNKAKKDKKHPLHFDNAKDHEGFVGGKKTAAHKEAYHREHENAIHTVHALATHPEFKSAVKGKHQARVMGASSGELSPLWKSHGAKNATSKADIAIINPKSEKGEGIRISMKKGGGSQLMSAGPEETAAVYHHAANEMLNTHPDYKKLPEKKKKEIHAGIMAHVATIGKSLNAMKTAPREKLAGHKNKAQNAIDTVHNEHPSLNHFIRKEATTGKGKFGEGSPHAASYIVKSAAGKKEPVVKNVDDMDFSGPKPRAALPKGTGRSGNVKVDERT